MKNKKTALTSTWKNLPLEATKNSKKILNEELTKNAQRNFKIFNTSKKFKEKTSLLSKQLIEKFAKT